jgi:CelD/BcsL family acetyltransferase involved in cellulose biosynthesis
MTTGNRILPVLNHLDRSELLRLGPEWEALLAGSQVRSAFMTWPWVSAWLDTLGRDADLEVLAARHPVDGRLLGVAPFFVESGRKLGVPFRSLRMIGSGLAAPDHLDMPVAADAGLNVATHLWEAVDRRRRWDFIDFDGMAIAGTLPRLLLRRRGDAAEETPCPYLPLEGGWDRVEQRFGRNHRQNIGRYRRKLDREAGAPVVAWMVARSSDLEKTMDHLAAMHQAVRTAQGDRGSFATEAMVSFHRETARRMLAAGRLRLWRLDVGDSPIAVIECFRVGEVVSFYTTGFDPAWAAFGPGREIMARAIQGAIDEGALEFDFLRGDEEYKASWGTETRTDLRIRRPLGARGRTIWAGRGAIGALRSFGGARRPRI